MTQPRTEVTVIGLGAMSRALARALLDAGHPVIVWNRTVSRADELVARGATLAPTAAGAIAATELAIVCLLDDGAVHEVLAPANLDGKLVVNLTNGTPAQAEKTATWALGHGAAYLHGGIMAVPPMIGGPGAFILFSGARPAFDRAERTLAVLGRPVYAGEEAGLASLQDLALCSAMYGMFAGAWHAFALVGSAGVDVEAFDDDLLIPWLKAMIALLPEQAANYEGAAYASEDSNAAMQVTGIENMIAASRDQGLPDETLGHLHTTLHSLRSVA
jgi:3-hydroxyisobutyrate dehydrogenase-like beta-hydroxyacid dehydrogenase